MVNSFFIFHPSFASERSELGALRLFFGGKVQP